MSDKDLMSILLYIYNRMDASPTPLLSKGVCDTSIVIGGELIQSFVGDCYLIVQPL